ncbi:hypothetical protein GPJ59_33190, partial [Streptomyces bambusae]|nr:hypothetical protein [Streptomyces bambusae]
MTTALFIHGTGVREPGFTELYGRFSAGLAEVAPGVGVAPYYWGGELGARLGAGGLSVPSTGGRSRGDGLGEGFGGGFGDGLGDGFGRGLDGGPGGLSEPGDDEAERWAGLYRDPLAELALAAGASAGRDGRAGSA